MFAIEVECLDLNKIYKTVQALRWFKVHENKYIITYKNKVICAEQTKNWLKLTCSEEEFWDIWYNYFDMNFDYAEASFKMRKNKVLKKAQVVAKGLRIINTDILEMMIILILLEHYPKKSVRRIINNISMICSKRKKNRVDGIEFVWYEFPPATKILDKKEKLSLYKLKKGYDEIISLCMFIENGTFDFSLSYRDMKKQLKELGIMSAKTANMICLYAFNMKEAFPFSNKVVESMYMNKLNVEDFNTIRDVRGLANRYLLYYDKNVKKFAKSYLQMAKEVL